ncbi:MAG: SAM-dependent DNA methyltransferase, partial [Verrucomicrobiota bacterium]
DGLKSQVFDNKEFGYWKVTVERPLRKSAQFTAERIAPLRFDKSLAAEMEWMFSQWGADVYKKDFFAGKKEKIQRWLDHEQFELTGANLKKLLDPKLWLARRELLEIAEKLQKHFGDETCDQIWNNFTLFTEDVKTVIGYEISFNKYFYVHQPLRDLAEVVKEIRDLEAETKGLLEQILSFSA